MNYIFSIIIENIKYCYSYIVYRLYNAVGIFLVTTIQVEEETVKMLKNLKHELGYETYNELIRTLVLENKRLKKSKKGKFPKLKKFKREELDRFSSAN